MHVRLRMLGYWFVVWTAFVMMFAGTASAATAAPACAVVMQFAGRQQSGDELNPAVGGGVLVFYWSQLEPQKYTKYADAQAAFASIIDPQMKMWSSAGKKVIIRISPAGEAKWDKPFSANGTPSWVYSEEKTAGYPEQAQFVVDAKPNPVDPASPGDGAVMPVYWNPIYLSELNTFLGYFAQYYGSNPNVALVELAVGDGGEMLVDQNHSGPTQNADVFAIFQAAGYSDELWFDTAKKIMAAYQSTIGTKVPLAMMTDHTFLGVSCTQNRPPAYTKFVCPAAPEKLRQSDTLHYAVSKGIWLQDNGFKVDTKPYRDPWNDAAGIVTEARDPVGADLPAMLTHAQEQQKSSPKMKYLLIFRNDIYYNQGQNQAALLAYKAACIK